MEIGYCFDCNELNYAITNNNGVYERANMSNNHVGHNQHVFGRPADYCAPICNVLTKLQATLPISHNEIILFKLAIDLGALDQYDPRLDDKPNILQEAEEKQLSLFEMEELKAE